MVTPTLASAFVQRVPVEDQNWVAADLGGRERPENPCVPAWPVATLPTRVAGGEEKDADDDDEQKSPEDEDAVPAEHEAAAGDEAETHEPLASTTAGGLLASKDGAGAQGDVEEQDGGAKLNVKDEDEKLADVKDEQVDAHVHVHMEA